MNVSRAVYDAVAVDEVRARVGGGVHFRTAALQAVVSAWQYLVPRSFYDDFPTVRLDPPCNEHLVTDIGGLGLALSAMSFIAAVLMDTKVTLTALTGYLMYAASHFTFHVTHFDDFSLRDVSAGERSLSG